MGNERKNVHNLSQAKRRQSIKLNAYHRLGESVNLNKKH